MHIVYYRTWRPRYERGVRGIWYHRAPRTYWAEMTNPAVRPVQPSDCVWIIPGTYEGED